MRWGSAASTAPTLAAAVDEAAGSVRAALDGVAPDLVVAFVSPHHAETFDELPGLVRAALGSGLLLGCSAGGVIGAGREIEEQPGLSLTAATLPGVTISPFHLEAPEPPPTRHDRGAHLHPAARPVHLRRRRDAPPARRGMAGLDGHRRAGERRPDAGRERALPGRQRSTAAAWSAVALTGNVVVDTIVAQGCRPIGEPMFVTRSERNVIHELDGRRAGAVLQELYERSTADDRGLFRHSLFLGVVMREDRQQYGQGDFLIRNVMGIDGKTGALVVGTLARDGMVVQFHLRDADTSAADLDALLTRYRGEPAGALLFSCLGRGKHLYGAPDHDTDAFRQHAGDVPLGGFFCNGEIGPVQGITYLHGYTSAFGLFRPRR